MFVTSVINTHYKGIAIENITKSRYLDNWIVWSIKEKSVKSVFIVTPVLFIYLIIYWIVTQL